MCDSGSHAHPLYLLQLHPRDNITNVCVCVFGCLRGCMWVRDTRRGLGVALRQVDHPGWPVLTGWYVRFFRGLLRGPHRSHACMTHGAVSVCLSVLPSAHSPVQLPHGVAFKRATEQEFTLSGYVTLLFIDILQQKCLSIHLKACITTPTPW